MSPFPARRAPCWFVVLLHVCFAVACWSVTSAPFIPGGAGAHDAPPSVAFWAFLIVLAEVVWKGVEVAGKVALHVLQYSVHLLWRFATLIARGVGQLGQYAWVGLRKAWHLLRLTYDKVLKPAWKVVWKWVDKTERWLQRTFGPLMKWLRRLRTWVLDFYKDYIRPILDIIDVSRRALRVLSSLGVEWAKRLDAKLAEIQAAIDRPFRLLVAKINEVINVVNRVVTADGLFQRLAHVRSIERDIAQIVNTWHNSQSEPLTDAQRKAALARDKHKTGAQVIEETRRYLRTGEGPRAASIDEWSAQLARGLTTR